MKLDHLLAASAALALCGGVAYAQTPPADAGKDQPPAASSSTTTSTEAVVPGSSTTDQSVSATSTTTTAATATGTNASFTTTMVTNGPVPDTAENRAKYGQPLSRAGKRTAARGN